MTDQHTQESAHESTSPITKILTIVGFLVTIGLIIWLIITAVRLAPGGFASLATSIENMGNYRKPVESLELMLEKEVVNSAEPFEISWTDMKQEGEYHFTYTCTQGVTLEVKSGDGTLVPMGCSDTLTLPATVHTLSLTIISKEMRFTDVPVMLSFVSKENETPYESTIKITVVNASIPVKDDTKTQEEKPVATPEVKPKPTQVTPTPQKPVVTMVYPQSNPNGYTDLSVTTIGSGVLKNGVFTPTASYDTDDQNAIRFTIKNIGTKTSGSWTFETKLPDMTYESDTQISLKPQEYVTFTIGFGMSDSRNDRVEIKTTVDTKNDTSSKNDSSVWSVKVTD